MAYQFVICDGQSERQDTVASVVEEALIRLDWKSFRQVRVSTLTERSLWPRTVFYSHLFLLSLELDGVPELGWELYRKNHWAPIVFYGTRKQAEPINDLLRARPAAFWNTENGGEELRELLQIHCPSCPLKRETNVCTCRSRLFFPSSPGGRIMWTSVMKSGGRSSVSAASAAERQ